MNPPPLSAFQFARVAKRLLFLAGGLFAYRLGLALPLPWADLRESAWGTASLLSLAGGDLSRSSIFSLGLAPYLNASLLALWLSARKNRAATTRALTAALALLQAGLLVAAGARPDGLGPALGATLTLAAGAMLLSWLAEELGDRALGNGVAWIAAAGIVSRVGSAWGGWRAHASAQEYGWLESALILAAIYACGAALMWIFTAQRKVPVHYAKRVVGRQLMGGMNSALPVKLETHGLQALMHAASLLSLLGAMSLFLPDPTVLGGPLLRAVFFALALWLARRLALRDTQPEKASESIKQMGGFIPGIRPGDATVAHLRGIVARSGFFASAALALIGAFLLPWKGAGLAILLGTVLEGLGTAQAYMMMGADALNKALAGQKSFR